MNRITLLVLGLLFSAGVAAAGAFLDYFQGRSDGDNVTLEWRTRTESNVQYYEVLRKAGYTSEYVSLGTVEPRGGNTVYSFVDRSAYKDSGSMYVYRLKIVESGGAPPSYSNEVTVSHNVSSVKRTWGSIKAMFR